MPGRKNKNTKQSGPKEATRNSDRSKDGENQTCESDCESWDEELMAAGQDPEVCSNCEKKVMDSQDGIQCEYCEYWFHTGCLKISSQAYKSLAGMKHSPVWLCQECKCRFKNLKRENKKLRQKLNEDRREDLGLKEKVDTLTAQ